MWPTLPTSHRIQGRTKATRAAGGCPVGITACWTNGPRAPQQRRAPSTAHQPSLPPSSSDLLPAGPPRAQNTEHTGPRGRLAGRWWQCSALRCSHLQRLTSSVSSPVPSETETAPISSHSPKREALRPVPVPPPYHSMSLNEYKHLIRASAFQPQRCNFPRRIQGSE